MVVRLAVLWQDAVGGRLRHACWSRHGHGSCPLWHCKAAGIQALPPLQQRLQRQMCKIVRAQCTPGLSRDFAGSVQKLCLDRLPAAERSLLMRELIAQQWYCYSIALAGTQAPGHASPIALGKAHSREAQQLLRCCIPRMSLTPV